MRTNQRSFGERNQRTVWWVLREEDFLPVGKSRDFPRSFGCSIIGKVTYIQLEGNSTIDCNHV